MSPSPFVTSSSSSSSSSSGLSSQHCHRAVDFDHLPGHKRPQIRRQKLNHTRNLVHLHEKTHLFGALSLCLSRACLGKMIIFCIKSGEKHKKGRLLHTDAARTRVPSSVSMKSERALLLPRMLQACKQTCGFLAHLTFLR